MGGMSRQLAFFAYQVAVLRGLPHAKSVPAKAKNGRFLRPVSNRKAGLFEYARGYGKQDGKATALHAIQYLQKVLLTAFIPAGTRVATIF